MSKIILVGEHQVEIPDMPSDRKKVLFVDEKDGYWRRDILIDQYRPIWFEFIPHFTKVYQDATLYDQDGLLISLNKDDSEYIERIYNQEINRRLNGVWFKNGKDYYEYLTGSHYFLLMWSRMQTAGMGDYAAYREFQRDYFYLIDHVNRSKTISGLFVSKPKKTGITNLHWSGYYLNKATLFRNKNMGNMNIKQDQGAKTFRDYFLYSYNGMVAAMKPQFKNKSENDGSIIFGKSHVNSKKNRLIAVQDMESELNTNVFCVATENKAFDVAVMNDCWYDEAPKFTKSFDAILTSNKDAIKIGPLLNGRNWITSYTPDEDGQSFREARTIFENSELKTIRNGKTKSGMICWHIPAYASWVGENNDCFNKHGQCNEKKAMEEIQQERDVWKGNTRELQAIIRRFANTKREAWGSAGAGSVFDNIRFGDLLAELELDQVHANAPYVEGNFEWENNLWNIQRNKRTKGEFSKVRFVPLTEDDIASGKTGKFRKYNDIPFSQQNSALKQGRDEWGCLIPPARYGSIMGGDPTNYAAASEVIQSSKNAGFVFSLPDEKIDARRGSISTKVLQFEYYDRPELPEEAFEDFLMLLIYTGALSLIEANMPYVATRMLEEGLGRFMIVRDENGIMKIWERYMGLPKEAEKKYQLIRMTANSANKEFLEILVRVIKNYFQKPRPGSGEKDYGPTFQSARTLKQIMDFDATDTKRFDLVMALGYVLLGIDIYVDILLASMNDFQNPENLVSVLEALQLES